MFRPLRTPTVLQRDAVECGAACLGIVLGHHGRFVPLGELRAACGVSRDGSKALKIVQAATAYGLDAAGYSTDLEHLKTFEAPYIIHWGFDHFLVVEQVGKDSVLLNDPRRGHWRATAEEFAENFTGVVLTMTPGPEFRRGGQPERMSSSIRKRLRGHFWPILLGLIAGILLVVPRVLFSAAAAVFIDRILFEGRGEWATPVAWLMVAAILTQFLLEFLKMLAARRMQLSLAAHTAGEFVWRALRLPVPFFEHRFPAEVGQRVNLNDSVSQLLSRDLVDTGVSLVTMAIYAAVLAVISWPLALASLVLAAVNFIALQVIFARRQEISQRLAAADEKLYGASLTGVHAIESIKSSGMEAGYFARWAGFQSQSVMARQELETATLPLETLPVLTRGLTLTAVLALGGFLIASGNLTLGGLVAFQILLNSFLTPVQEIVELFGKLQETHADLLRLEDVMTTEPDPRAPGTNAECGVRSAECGVQKTQRILDPAAPRSPSRNGVKLRGELSVRDLSYGYSPLDPPLLKDFEFRVGPGQWLGIVGGSGSGKSTLARLLTGLYEPWTGEIRLDGKTRDEFPPGLLSAAMAYVDQEIVLYEGSVRENLSLWESAVPDEVLLQACRDAAAWEVVQALPGGLSGQLQEGGINLSGGERQRLEIARAMAADPAVLVLDEATSALDAETERRVHEGLRRRGCTCVVIAHRLSAIRQCDQVLLVDSGRIVSRGTHAELWNTDAAYRRFFRGGAA